MHFLFDYGLFLLKVITAVAAILIVVAGIIAIASKGKQKHRLQVKKLNKKFAELRHKLQQAMHDKKQIKKLLKQQKKVEKKQKNQKSDKRVFVLSFNGDIKASATNNLRAEITALLTIATEQDEVVVCVESPGGLVHGYGLAASQLQRIRDRNIPLTIAVDKVAASGGYMMACVANKILAAPFSIIGSIGVIAQIPNFHKLLKKHDIDFEQITAGEYKRTLTMFGENTEKGREKFKEELEQAHHLFKDFIKRYRPQIDIDQVATGEHWFAAQAIEFNLVDELMTSDDYLMYASEKYDVYSIKHRSKQSLMKRLGASAEQAISYLRSAY